MATMRVNRLATRLNLTDAQKTSAIGIFTTAYTNAQSIQTNLQTNRDALSAAIKKNDTASIDQLSLCVRRTERAIDRHQQQGGGRLLRALDRRSKDAL